MKKLLNKILLTVVAIAMVVTVAMFAGCAKTYVQKTKFGNADYDNMTRTLTLVDDTNYTLDVLSTDSQDASKTTAHLELAGTYTISEDGTTVTLDLTTSTGHMLAYQGDQVAVDTDIENAAGAMQWYAMCMGGATATNVLILDGKTFEVQMNYDAE